MIAELMLIFIPNVLANASPSFFNKEIYDNISDYIDLNTKVDTRNGDPHNDITSVDYYSDGKVLNATLWLLFPFKEHPTTERVNYGIYIDSDFDDRTGHEGIDYKFEIQWNNKTQSWSKILAKWSANGQTRVLENITNYKGFYGKNEGSSSYVMLSVNLTDIQSPEKYKILFYAESKLNGSYKTDFTKWLAIPPLNLVLSMSPNILTLQPGEQKTVELRVNSTEGYEPTVTLFTINQSKADNIKTDFKFSTLRIPSYGVVTTPLTITASNDALIKPYTVFIFANSTFPPEELIKTKKTNLPKKPPSPIPESVNRVDNIIAKSSFLVTVKDPLTIGDKISDFWNKLGAPLSFIYGIATGSLPLIYTWLKKTIKKKQG